MYLIIKCREFCNFRANWIHTDLLKAVRFVFCVIILVIPSMLCFPSFLTISYRFPWCFRMFPLVFLRFPWVFLLFSLGVFPVFYFRFSKHSDPALNFNNNIIYHATSQKHLGIILDNRLSFKKLLRLVFSKINKITGFLRKRQCLIPR